AVPAGQQVRPDGDGVLGLLGGPEVVPLLPHRALREVPLEDQVVVGEVVLGEQVQDERRAGPLVDRRLGLLPGLLHEAAAFLPGNELVEVPGLAPLPVLGQQLGYGRLESLDELEVFVVCHGVSSRRERGGAPPLSSWTYPVAE